VSAKSSDVKQSRPLLLQNRWLLQNGEAPTAAGAAGDVGGRRQTTEFEEDFAQARAIFQIHFYKFEGHGLGTRTANQRLSLDSAHALSHFQSDQSSGSEMAFAGADAAAEIELRNVEAEVFTQVGSNKDEIAIQL
jgi:hypothetical protein